MNQYNLHKIDDKMHTTKQYCELHAEEDPSSEKPMRKNNSETYICFHQNCNTRVYCCHCGDSHREHEREFMALDDALDMMEELLFSLKKSGTERASRATQMLEKFKLLEEFKAILDRKWKSIENELVIFLNSTEQLIQQYSLGKKKVQAEIEQLDEQAQDITRFSQSYRLSSRGNICFREGHLSRMDEDWSSKLMSLAAEENQFKDYTMKIIEVLTDQDYNVFDQNLNGKENAKKFIKLHEEMKGRILQKKDSLLCSESTQVGLSSRGSEGEGEIEREKDSHQKKGKKKREKRTSENKLWISKLMDLYQVKQT